MDRAVQVRPRPWSPHNKPPTPAPGPPILQMWAGECPLPAGAMLQGDVVGYVGLLVSPI